MLRLLVLVLLLANASYFAWSQGLLAPWGAAPLAQSEPRRLAQQLKPQAVRVMAADEARRIETGAGGPRPAECLQAGIFSDAETEPLKRALDSWPAGSWSIEPGAEPARWIVYMGKYASTEQVARKKGELRQLGVSFEPLVNAALEPGVSLGGYGSEPAAKAQLESLVQKGVRTARVVLERPEAKGQSLKLPAVDDSLRPRLDELKTALGGRTLRVCR